MRTVIPRLSLSLCKHAVSIRMNAITAERKWMSPVCWLLFSRPIQLQPGRATVFPLLFFFQHDGRNPYTVPKCYLYTLFYRMAVRKDRATNWRGPDACGALVLCSTSPRARYTANRRRRRRRRWMASPMSQSLQMIKQILFFFLPPSQETLLSRTGNSPTGWWWRVNRRLIAIPLLI